MRELALFSGIGGGILGGQLLGWRTTCAVEIDPYCREILLARQRDGYLPEFPIWDDVRTFDGRPWRGSIDVISGGFPCQDISSAGSRTGLTGAKSGLWFEYARIIAEVQPQYVFIENSAHLRTRGLVRVLQDLAALGYDAAWGVLGASSVGAPHHRKRMWIAAANAQGERRGSRGARRFTASSTRQQQFTFQVLANSHGGGQRDGSLHAEVARAPELATDVTNTNSSSLRQQSALNRSAPIDRRTQWWPMDCFTRVDDGRAHRMDRVRATGNAQVPGVAALAWQVLSAEAEAQEATAAE